MSSRPPIACTLTPDELRARRGELLPGLAARAERVELTADGARLQFAERPGLVTDIARVIDAERRCCRFLRFELLVPPGAGAVTLTISAPPEGRAVIEELVSPSDRPM